MQNIVITTDLNLEEEAKVIKSLETQNSGFSGFADGRSETSPDSEEIERC